MLTRELFFLSVNVISKNLDIGVNYVTNNVKYMYGKFSKISNTKKERTPYFLPSLLKQREVTNFAKGGN